MHLCNQGNFERVVWLFNFENQFSVGDSQDVIEVLDDCGLVKARRHKISTLDTQGLDKIRVVAVCDSELVGNSFNDCWRFFTQHWSTG